MIQFLGSSQPCRKRFCAQGILNSGGVFFVILNENRPSGTVIVTNPGKFNVVMKIPKDRLYSVGLMNYVARYNTLENRMYGRQSRIGRRAEETVDLLQPALSMAGCRLK